MSSFVMSNIIGRSHFSSLSTLSQQSDRIEQRISTGDLVLSKKEDGYLQATASRLNRQLENYRFDIEDLRTQKRIADQTALGYEKSIVLMDRALSLADAAKAQTDSVKRTELGNQAQEAFKQAHILAGEPTFQTLRGDPYFSGIEINNGVNNQLLVAENFTPFTGDFTYEFSFTSSQSLVTFDPVLFSYTHDNGAGNDAILYAPNGDTRLLLEGSAKTATNVDMTPFFDGNRHQLSYTYNSTSGQMQLYMDGALQASVVDGSPTVGVSGPGVFAVGQEFDGTAAAYDPLNPTGIVNQLNQRFEGHIHDVRFYSDIRTGGEISSNMNQTLGSAEISDANLSSYWNIIGEGTTILDAKGAASLDTPNGFNPLNGGYYTEFTSFGETAEINAGNQGFRGWGTDALVDKDIALFEATRQRMQQEFHSADLASELIQYEIDQKSGSFELLTENSENLREVNDERESINLQLNTMRQQLAMSSIGSIVQARNSGLLTLLG